MASFKEIRELLLQFSVENNTINEEELFLLSEGFKSVNRLSMKRFESNQSRIKQYRTGFVVLYILQDLIAGGKISVQSHSFIYYGYTTLFTLIKFTGNSIYEI